MAKKPSASYNPFTNANRALSYGEAGGPTGNSGGGGGNGSAIGTPGPYVPPRAKGRSKRKMPRGRRKTR